MKYPEDIEEFYLRIKLVKLENGFFSFLSRVDSFYCSKHRFYLSDILFFKSCNLEVLRLFNNE